jgi:hypothetical protein
MTPEERETLMDTLGAFPVIWEHDDEIPRFTDVRDWTWWSAALDHPRGTSGRCRTCGSGVTCIVVAFHDALIASTLRELDKAGALRIPEESSSGNVTPRELSFHHKFPRDLFPDDHHETSCAGTTYFRNCYCELPCCAGPDGRCICTACGGFHGYGPDDAVPPGKRTHTPEPEQDDPDVFFERATRIPEPGTVDLMRQMLASDDRPRRRITSEDD